MIEVPNCGLDSSDLMYFNYGRYQAGGILVFNSSVNQSSSLVRELNTSNYNSSGISSIEENNFYEFDVYLYEMTAPLSLV